MLVREKNKHCVAHSDTVVIPAVTHSYWFTSSSGSSDQQISKISLLIDNFHFYDCNWGMFFSSVTEENEDRYNF